MTQVSAVIATYKRPAPLRRAIASILAQTVTDLEVIVAAEQDDTDAQAIAHTHPDPRVRLVVNPVKNGPGPARDFAARAAKGIYIAFLDDDDEWRPDKLERQLALADGRTIVTALSNVVTPAGVFVRPAMPYDDGTTIDEWLFDRQYWLKGNEAMLQTSSLLMPARLFDTLGFGAVRHEEWELVIRAIKQHGYRLVTVREPLVTYYSGGSYPWRTSLQWAASVRDLMSPRALGGFCLNSATQGLTAQRNRAFFTLFFAAFRLGRPTLKQLFAFFVMWVLPDAPRERLVARLRRRTA